MATGVRDRLLGSAVALLARNGVAGTGVAELLEHSRVSRRSVYLNFPGGKSELMAEATRTAGSAISGVVTTLVERARPAAAITAFAQYWQGVLDDGHFAAGCPIVAATLGRADAPEAADAAAAAFTDWIATLAARLERDGLAPAPARELATTVVAGIEGAVVLCLARGSAEPLEQTSRQLALLVEAQLRPTA